MYAIRSYYVFRANIIEQGDNGINHDNYARNKVWFDGQNDQNLDAFGGFARFEYDFEGMTLTAITAYESVDMFSVGDIDGGYGSCVVIGVCGPGYIPFDAETSDAMPSHSQWTQEIRLASTTGGPLDWIVGFFWFDEDFV